MVCDKGRTDVEIRFRLLDTDHRFLPLGEDRVRETGRNDGKDGRVLPQGSVLGPLLWNIAYDLVLTRTVLLEGVSLTCYADDTLLLAGGQRFANAPKQDFTRRWRPSGHRSPSVSAEDGSVRVSSSAKPAYSRHIIKRRRRENRIGGHSQVLRSGSRLRSLLRRTSGAPRTKDPESSARRWDA